MKKLSLQPHPFRLLLYLEWILLGLSAFKLFGFPGWGRPVFWNNGEIYSTIATQTPQMVAFAILLAVFGAMGLWLPTVRWGKLLYLAIAFVPIGTIAQIQGWGLESLSPLLIVVVLRSCLLFGQVGKWTIAGLAWLVYPFTLAPFLALWVVVQLAKDNLESVTIPGLTILPTSNNSCNWGRSAICSKTPPQTNLPMRFAPPTEATLK
jgi:hypothetical protein